MLAVLVAGGVMVWRGANVYRTAYGGFKHIRYLLEEGEAIEGAPAEDVLSDNYLLSLFGNNPELVERLKTVVDLGLATDANLKLGNVSAMVVTYRKDPQSDAIQDAAIYALGGFPDPKSQRLGFHSSGHLSAKLTPTMWNSGTALINLLGRDIIVFCEEDKAEEHVSLVFGLLHGEIYPLAKKIAEAPLYYAIVFPEPKDIAPPNLRNSLQTVLIQGEMSGDDGQTEMMAICKNARSAAHVETILKDMLGLMRVTFHDHYEGYIKEMSWGKMNDSWWAVEYVALVDATEIVAEYPLIVARTSYDRAQNNAILKTIERAGRDLAAQKAFSLSSQLPWEFAHEGRNQPRAGYWSTEHVTGVEWPLGDDGIPTPGSIAAARERERLKAEREAEALRLREQQQQQAPQPAETDVQAG